MTKKKLNWDKILKLIPKRKQAQVKKFVLENYADVITTNHPIVVARQHSSLVYFAEDPLFAYLHEKINLNDLWKAYHTGRWDRKSMMRYYRGIGYSLGGFAEVFSKSGPGA